MKLILTEEQVRQAVADLVNNEEKLAKSIEIKPEHVTIEIHQRGEEVEFTGATIDLDKACEEANTKNT